MHPSRPNDRLFEPKVFGFALVLGSLLVGWIGYFMYSAEYAARFTLLRTDEAARMNQAALQTATALNGAVTDLLAQTAHSELVRYLESGTEADAAALADEYLHFSRISGRYDQIRFLDAQGMEKVRVNYESGTPRIVPREELQNKADRYYFKDAIRLGPGEVAVSAFDLNIEQGRIEEPPKPMIRFSTPVFDRDGRKMGVMVLNYLGQPLLDHLQELAGRGAGRIMLLNAEGQWINGGGPDRDWSFMYPERQAASFAWDFPQTFALIRTEENGQILDDAGLFTFTTLRVPPGEDSRLASASRTGQTWYLVLHVEAEQMAKLRWTTLRQHLPATLAALLAILLASLALSSAVRTRRRAAAEILQAKELAEDANRAKSEFLAKMSHEIRTPMNAIVGMAELALQSGLPPEQQEHVTTIKLAADNLLAVINDILDLSKVEARKVELENIHFDLREMLDSALAPQVALAGSKDIFLESAVAEDVPPALMGDPFHLRQVLVNLLGNAVKFTDRGGVNLDVRRGDSLPTDPEGSVRILFRVEDTGIGIPREQQEAIFQGFRQAEASTTRRYGGTGLGLAISRQLVEIMGGRLQVASEPGQGSTFFFSLPLLPGSKEKIIRSPDPEAAAPTAGRSLKVLLAEDNEMNVKVTSAFLHRLGHAMVHAANGREAMSLLRSEPFDLILMDVEMPEMDGLTATRNIRAGLAGEAVRNIPIVALTAHALTSYMEQCQEAGMNEVMTKPVVYQEFARLLAQYAERIGPRPEQAQAPARQAPPELWLLNLQAALDRFDGDESLLREICADVAQSLPERMRDLRQALDDHDLTEAAMLGHKLKSSCGTVGAETCQAIAARLEHAARNHQRSQAEALLGELEEETDRLLPLLRERLQTATD